MELIIDTGKVVEPSKVDKAKAAILRDKEAVIVLPFADVHQMVTDKIMAGCSWLGKYKWCAMKYNPSDNSFTLTMSIEK